MEKNTQDKQELVETAENKHSDILHTVKETGASMSKKTMLVIAAGAVLAFGGGFLVSEMNQDNDNDYEYIVEQNLENGQHDNDYEYIVEQNLENGQHDNDYEYIVEQNLENGQSNNDNHITFSNETAEGMISSAESPKMLAEAYGIKLVDQSELDGVYKATVAKDTYTLTIKGSTATLVETESDGDQDLEQILFDFDKKLAYIDGEVESYTVEGKTLTLTEVDNGILKKERIKFTKQ